MASALSVVLMLITGILPALMYVLPLVTGIIVYLISFVSNKKYALGVYFSTSVLSIFLLADKETALAYAMFFGYYPLLKGCLEKLPKLASLVLKLVLFNGVALLIGVIGVALLGISTEEYSEFGTFTVPILLGLANIMFFMYDLTLKKYEFLIRKLSKKLVKIFK